MFVAVGYISGVLVMYLCLGTATIATALQRFAVVQQRFYFHFEGTGL